jgi:hypothetical protein
MNIEGIGARRRRSRGEVELLVAEYESSGLSRKAFCAGRDLAVATLDLYRKQVGQMRGGPRLVAVELSPAAAVPVNTSAATLPVTVVLANGRRIELGGRLDAVVLTELIGIVERA